MEMENDHLACGDITITETFKDPSPKHLFDLVNDNKVNMIEYFAMKGVNLNVRSGDVYFLHHVYDKRPELIKFLMKYLDILVKDNNGYTIRDKAIRDRKTKLAKLLKLDITTQTISL